MKDLDKIAKNILWIGLLVYIVACIIAGVFNLNVTNTWLAIIIMVITYTPLTISGYLYTSKPELKKSKRYYIIRALIIFFGMVLISLIGAELRAIIMN